MQIIILKIKRDGVILMKLEYTKYGNYYLPNIVMPEESKETKGKDIGQYGRLRLNFLREHKRVLYQDLLLNNKLEPNPRILKGISLERTKRINFIKESTFLGYTIALAIPPTR